MPKIETPPVTQPDHTPVATPDPAANSSPDPKSSEASGKQAKTRLMIPSQTGPGGSDDVFLSVNGRDYLIKRDAEVEVPPSVLEALKHAVITDYVTDADGRIVRERQVPRFPFQVL